MTLSPVRRTGSAGAASLALAGLVSSLALLLPGTAADAAPARAAQQEPAARFISLLVSKKEVVKGKKLKLSGVIEAPTDATCAVGQTVDVERSTKGASFPSVATVTTDANGAYKFKIKVTKKARYKVSLAASATCVAAESPPRTVDVIKPAR